MRKRGLQVSFAWLFSIIVGAMILFLAIYMVAQFMDTGQKVSTAEVAKKIEILLSPLETGFESLTKTEISFNADTKINFGCKSSGTFGAQIINVDQMSFGKWSETDVMGNEIQNKYIFAEERITDREFLVLLKPFDFPFKVGDLFYIIPMNKKYCFLDAPENIENELSGFEQDTILFEECERHVDIVNVCFESARDCDIKVSYDRGYVDKGGVGMSFYEDALMYAAIFSDKSLYECNLKRLMKRAGTLNEIYLKKIGLTGCGENLKTDLNLFQSNLDAYDDSSDLGSLSELAEKINDLNEDNRVCSIW
jgi:hypothetical protein